MEKQKEVLRVLLKNYTKISRNGGISKVIFDDKFEDIAEEIVKLFSIHVFSKSVAVEYAEFCVRCDREKLPLLCLEDYIKQYCC